MALRRRRVQPEYVSTPAERRRLARILADPDYGVPLVRLSKKDQRYVLDLISAGDRRARAEILRLDAARREKRTLRDRARIALQRLPGGRERALDAAEARVSRHCDDRGRGDPGAWRKRAERYATPEQLAAIIRAEDEEAYMRMLNNHAWDTDDYCPFWYH